MTEQSSPVCAIASNADAPGLCAMPRLRGRIRELEGSIEDHQRMSAFAQERFSMLAELMTVLRHDRGRQIALDAIERMKRGCPPEVRVGA